MNITGYQKPSTVKLFMIARVSIIPPLPLLNDWKKRNLTSTGEECRQT